MSSIHHPASHKSRNYPNQLSTRQRKNMITPITDTEALYKVCEAFSTSAYVTVDTEFLRENSYYPYLCLIQIADENNAYIIDPLAKNIDLTPFYTLMMNPNVTKVLHACRQDIEIFFHQSGQIPTPLFDTQVAAMVCGFGDSAGYETLVNSILGQSIDKSARFTDWSRRPLNEKQLSYALGDVTHLRDIYAFLLDKLEKKNRGTWVKEEMNVLCDPQTYQINPMEAWKRIKSRMKKPKFLCLLQYLAAWRENSAQSRNVPRARILKDEILLEIAANPPKRQQDLENIRGISKGFYRSQAGSELFNTLKKAQNVPEQDWPTVPNTPKSDAPPVTELLKVLLKQTSYQHGVATRLIANAKDLEAWARNPEKQDFQFLHGWRHDIFGHYAQQLINGDIALTNQKGKIKTIML